MRIPGALGNAMGIVGGLIVGSAAVEANLVSPIVVMVVAITALGSLAIPNEEFASAFRLLKYFFLFLGGYLGIFGIVIGVYLTVSHLAGLLSFGVPYLVPFVKYKRENGSGTGILRIPFRKRWKRPMYAREDESVRLRRQRIVKEEEEQHEQEDGSGNWKKEKIRKKNKVEETYNAGSQKDIKVRSKDDKNGGAGE